METASKPSGRDWCKATGVFASTIATEVWYNGLLGQVTWHVGRWYPSDLSSVRFCRKVLFGDAAIMVLIEPYDGAMKIEALQWEHEMPCNRWGFGRYIYIYVYTHYIEKHIYIYIYILCVYIYIWVFAFSSCSRTKPGSEVVTQHAIWPCRSGHPDGLSVPARRVGRCTEDAGSLHVPRVGGRDLPCK